MFTLCNISATKAANISQDLQRRSRKKEIYESQSGWNPSGSSWTSTANEILQPPYSKLSKASL